MYTNKVNIDTILYIVYVSTIMSCHVYHVYHHVTSFDTMVLFRGFVEDLLRE